MITHLCSKRLSLRWFRFLVKLRKIRAAVTFLDQPLGPVVSASASVLVGPRGLSAGSYQDLIKIGTAAFLPGARCAEELQGTHPEHRNKPSELKAEIVQTQSWRYKTVVVIKRQQQTTISNKQVTFWEDSGRSKKLFLTAPLLVCLAFAIAYLRWPYVLTFVEGTLLKCSFVERSLVGGDSIGALYRTINVLEVRVLVRWSAEKQLSGSCVFERGVCRCSLTFVFFVFVKILKGAR